MSKSLLWLLQAALLAVLFEPKVCSTGEIFPVRRVRSSNIETSQYISDNMSNLMENKPTANSARPPEQHAHQHQSMSEPNVKRISNTNVNDNIRRIFHVGPEMGLTLFNNTFNTPITDQMQADDTFRGSSPNEQQPFKVQRTPEGKLNVIFNDFLFLQRPTEAQNVPKVTHNKGWIYPDEVYVANDPVCQDGGGKSFCTAVKNYPAKDQLDQLLKSKFSQLEMFFSEDLPETTITQRMGNEPTDQCLCESVARIIYPEAAQTKDNNWLLIVNNKVDYKQGVRIEECKNPNAPCDIAQFPNKYVSKCKQNYIFRSLVAITPNGTIEKDHFRMPSCCQCIVNKT